MTQIPLPHPYSPSLIQNPPVDERVSCYLSTPNVEDNEKKYSLSIFIPLQGSWSGRGSPCGPPSRAPAGGRCQSGTCLGLAGWRSECKNISRTVLVFVLVLFLYSYLPHIEHSLRCHLDCPDTSLHSQHLGIEGI